MKLMLRLLLLLFSCIVNAATSEYIIRGEFQNIQENSIVVLSQYSYEENIISKTTVHSGICTFNDLPELQEGVYQIIISQSKLKNDAQNVYAFNIILDAYEHEITFKFNPTENNLPTFLKSDCNKSWVEYLKSYNFRLNTIKCLMENSRNSNRSNATQAIDFKTVLAKEISELKEIRSSYLKENSNKWCFHLTKNNSEFALIEGISKDIYWELFETSNPDLINSPIYQDLIRNYIVNYCNHSDQEQYKEAFQKIIEVFSKNEATKNWVLKYVIAGLYKTNNMEVASYFTKKYNYKI